MCITYLPPTPAEVDYYDAHMQGDLFWKEQTWRDYAAPIIIPGPDRTRQVVLGTYGMVPKSHIPEHVRDFDTMNARSETVAKLRSFSKAWKEHQFCLVPCTAFFEPRWEEGVHERWSINLTQKKPFAVAGLWKTWNEPDGTTRNSFTQLTVNATDHPFMSQFHKDGKEKRSLVILDEKDYDDWLNCEDTEFARSFLQLYPAELMTGQPAPAPPRTKKT